MKPLEDILPRILPICPNCPEPIALDAIRRAAQDFCERTRAWRDTSTFNVTKTSSNWVVAPYEAAIHKIEAARFDDVILEEVSLSWLNEHYPGWRDRDADLPTWITQEDFNTVTLVPAATGSLTLTTILKPSFDTDSLPNWMVDMYSRQLADGALAEMLRLPGQTFYNPDLSTFHSTRFQGELDRLSNVGQKGQIRAPTRTKASFF